MSNNRLSGLPAKQKLIMLVAIVILGIVGWQVLSLFSNGDSVTPPPQPAAAPATQGHAPQAGGTAAGAQPQGQSPAVTLTERSDIRFSPDTNRQQLLQQQKDMLGYLDKVNKLKSLKVERDIAETSEAIANSNLARASAEKNLSNLLVPNQASVADYASKLGTSAASEEQAEAAPIAKPAIDYLVVSISMQLNVWTAVLGYQGKLYSVTVGDTLPADGSVVTAINADSVTLKTNTKVRKISIVSTI